VVRNTARLPKWSFARWLACVPLLVALAGLAYERNPAALLIALALAAVVVIGAPRLPSARPIAALLLLALGVHLIALVAIREASLALAMDGFVTGDDAAYADVAWKLALSWQGVPQPSLQGGQAYLLGTFVYLEAIVFLVLGPNVVAAQVLNVGFMLGLVVASAELARRLFGAREALATATVLAFFPSLIVWSALNLKDTLVWLVTVLVVLAVVRFVQRPGILPFAAVVAMLVPMISLRRYVFLELTLIFVFGVVLAHRLPSIRRLLWTTAAVASSLLLYAASQVLGPSVIPLDEPLSSLEATRYNMGVGARTSFQDTFPAEEGQTYVISGPAGVAGSDAASAPAPSPRVIQVKSGTQIVLVSAAATAMPTSAETVLVRPGDIVVVGDSTATPKPEGARQLLPFADTGRPVTITSTDPGDAILRTLVYLPRGLTYALIAPFPWTIGRPADLLPVPEMLFWYVLVGSALFSIWKGRSQWRSLLPAVAFCGGTLLALALIEGNVGTLYRHRAMVVPLTVMLSAPVLASLGARLRMRMAQRRLSVGDRR
jgi:hypothetical protein